MFKGVFKRTLLTQLKDSGYVDQRKYNDFFSPYTKGPNSFKQHAFLSEFITLTEVKTFF